MRISKSEKAMACSMAWRAYINMESAVINLIQSGVITKDDLPAVLPKGQHRIFRALFNLGNFTPKNRWKWDADRLAEYHQYMKESEKVCTTNRTARKAHKEPSGQATFDPCLFDQKQPQSTAKK